MVELKVSVIAIVFNIIPVVLRRNLLGSVAQDRDRTLPTQYTLNQVFSVVMIYVDSLYDNVVDCV